MPIIGGDWSPYCYNGFLYESDIARSPMVWNVGSPVVAGARKLHSFNPQTSEFTLD